MNGVFVCCSGSSKEEVWMELDQALEENTFLLHWQFLPRL